MLAAIDVLLAVAVSAVGGAEDTRVRLFSVPSGVEMRNGGGDVDGAGDPGVEGAAVSGRGILVVSPIDGETEERAAKTNVDGMGDKEETCDGGCRVVGVVSPGGDEAARVVAADGSAEDEDTTPGRSQVEDEGGWMEEFLGAVPGVLAPLLVLAAVTGTLVNGNVVLEMW